MPTKKKLLIIIIIVLKAFIIFLVDRIYSCFFVFYPIKRIYIQSTTIRIYFMTFIMQQLNIWFLCYLFFNALNAIHHYLKKKYSYLLLLIEFSMCQVFWHYDSFYIWSNFIEIFFNFYLYHRYFYFQDKCYSKNYLLLPVYNIFLLLHAQKDS